MWQILSELYHTNCNSRIRGTINFRQTYQATSLTSGAGVQSTFLCAQWRTHQWTMPHALERARKCVTSTSSDHLRIVVFVLTLSTYIIPQGCIHYQLVTVAVFNEDWGLRTEDWGLRGSCCKGRHPIDSVKIRLWSSHVHRWGSRAIECTDLYILVDGCMKALYLIRQITISGSAA